MSPLIEPVELASHVGDEHWLIVDCRADLARPQAGREAFAISHIPGAIHAHLDEDLSGPITPSTGRHPLPSAEQFAATLSRWGVDARTTVVAYDADNGAYAARLWWLLRWIGAAPARVLNGGFKAWQAAGLPTSTAAAHRAAAHFRARPNDALWVDAQFVAERVQQRDWRVLDARAPERFAGRIEPIDAVAGHVPGAANHPFTRNLDGSSKFLPAAELRKAYEQSQAGVADERTIVMCGSGVTACHLLLAMEVAGKPGARLYAGSWSEWIRDPARPVARE